MLSEARFDLREEERDGAHRAEAPREAQRRREESLEIDRDVEQEFAAETDCVLSRQASRVNGAHKVYRSRWGWCDSPSTDCQIRGNCTWCE